MFVCVIFYVSYFYYDFNIKLFNPQHYQLGHITIRLFIKCEMQFENGTSYICTSQYLSEKKTTKHNIWCFFKNIFKLSGN